MFWTIVLGIGAAIIGCVVIACLYLDDIKEWFESKKVNKKELGFLLKEKMSNGSYRVVSGIFHKKSEDIRETNEWETEELDDELEEFFDYEDYLELKI